MKLSDHTFFLRSFRSAVISLRFRLFYLFNFLLSSLSFYGSLFHKIALLGEVIFSTIVTFLTGLLVRVVADAYTSVVSAARNRLRGLCLRFGDTIVV
jgi:hypothetical protein